MLWSRRPSGIGFGLLSALALRHVSSVHGAVLTGLIPAATAGIAVLRAGERPRRAYWAALGLGLAVVVGFAVVQGGGRLRGADVILLVAIADAGLGYTEGGVLAREYGGWRVICWALILALPVSVPVTAVAAVAEPTVTSPRRRGRAGLRQPGLDVPGLLRLVPGPGPGRGGQGRPPPAGPARADPVLVGAAAGRAGQLARPGWPPRP